MFSVLFFILFPLKAFKTDFLIYICKFMPFLLKGRLKMCRAFNCNIHSKQSEKSWCKTITPPSYFKQISSTILPPIPPQFQGGHPLFHQEGSHYVGARKNEKLNKGTSSCTLNFLKAVFHKFYLVDSWVPWPIYSWSSVSSESFWRFVLGSQVRIRDHRQILFLISSEFEGVN